MAIKVFTTYRIKRALNQHEQMQRLVNAKVFDSYADILMISALIGFKLNRFVPITKNAADGVLMQFFTETDQDIIDLIAYSHTGDQTVLQLEEKYEIFSNFANGGFPILLENLGINNDVQATINEVDARRIKTHYYSLLLSDSFTDNGVVNDEDLFV